MINIEITRYLHLFQLVSLGQIPKVGDKVEDEFCHYEVIAMDNIRITRIRVTKKEIDFSSDDE